MWPNSRTLAYSVDEPQCKYGPDGESDIAMVTDHEVFPFSSISNDSVKPPTVTNVDFGDDAESTREKTTAVVESDTPGHNSEQNNVHTSNAVPITPINGKDRETANESSKLDTHYLPSDVFQDLSAICAQKHLSSKQKWSLCCKMMQSNEHLSAEDRKKFTEESK